VKRIVVRENDYVGPWIAEHGGGSTAKARSASALRRTASSSRACCMTTSTARAIYMHVAASTPHWLDREFLRVCFDYPFRQLGANVVIGLVPSTNEKARRSTNIWALN
jgi:hypothetical protein